MNIKFSAITKIAIALLILSACGGGGGGRKASTTTGWEYNNPDNGGFEVKFGYDQETGPGLVFIEGGTFTMGRVEQDLLYEWNNIPRRVTVSSFYMDQTEIRNVDYREYLYWIQRVFVDYPEVYKKAVPDTLVWRRPMAYNEPYVQYYFRHPAYNDYPVVGVTWEQANAFCQWRTEQKKNFLNTYKIQPIHSYRLPTEAEWEYAARGGRLNTMYPWGGYYTLNAKGCYRANFKPKRGNYIADSRYSSKTMKVGSFDPNDYGLFDMAGNVAEWTSTAYDIEGYQMMHDMNPEYQYDAQVDDPPALKRKVVRGGSWKDVAHYIQVSTRDYEYQDSATSFIGFRCVMNAIEDERKTY